jgi:DNA-binding NarL/FixJ family response regulator
MLSESENYIAMIKAGVMGFVVKTSGKNVLEKAIKTVIGGECFFSGEILRQIIVTSVSHQPIPDDSVNTDINISERELEVLQFLCKGFNATEIADKLFRSIKTIEAHRSKLLEKTNTKNTINLVLYAIRNKLVVIS